jgi:hypothetical protein
MHFLLLIKVKLFSEGHSRALSKVFMPISTMYVFIMPEFWFVVVQGCQEMIVNQRVLLFPYQ